MYKISTIKLIPTNITDINIKYAAITGISTNWTLSINNNPTKLGILKLAKLKKKKVAIHCSGADTGSFFLKKGFDMVTVSTDLNLLSKAISEELEKLKL